MGFAILGYINSKRTKITDIQRVRGLLWAELISRNNLSDVQMYLHYVYIGTRTTFTPVGEILNPSTIHPGKDLTFTTIAP